MGEEWDKGRNQKFLETNENELTTTQNLCDTAKAVLREVHSYTGLHKKNRNISNKQSKPTPTRTWGTTTKTTQRKYKEQITKIRAELNNIETKSTILRVNESRSWFFEKINKIDKPISRLIKKKKERLNKHNQKWRRTDYNWYHRNTKDCKKLLWRTVCQEIWKPRWNGHISRKI